MKCLIWLNLQNEMPITNDFHPFPYNIAYFTHGSPEDEPDLKMNRFQYNKHNNFC